MHTEILLCAGEDAANPYKFKITGIRVYSLEEALYHCAVYWKQSVDDFTSEEFIVWVKNELGLAYIATKIKLLAELQSFSDRLMGFLTLIDYLDEIQLAKLKAELAQWEKQLEWERLKERGDYLMQNGEPAKAYLFYKKALHYDENLRLLNNTGIALMHLEDYEDAVIYLNRAYDLEPDNLKVILNLAEASIYARSFEKALRLLKKAEGIAGPLGDIFYLYGELNFEAGNNSYAVDYFQKAIEEEEDPFYIYRLSQVYSKMRQYDKALGILGRIKKKDTKLLKRLAELHAEAGNIPAAVKSIEKALISANNSVELWTALAMYHRMDYDFNRANSAIIKALALDPDNDRAKLEQARIKKSLGKIKDYQQVLNSVLAGFKRSYRDIANLE